MQIQEKIQARHNLATGPGGFYHSDESTQPSLQQNGTAMRYMLHTKPTF